MPLVLIVVLFLHSSTFTLVQAEVLRADLYDVVDGKTIVRVTLDGQPVSQSDGLEWKLSSGTAVINEDGFTKLSLFKPSGIVPVNAQPVLGNIVGNMLRVGIDPDLVPPNERVFYVAGGGDCSGNGVHPMCPSVVVDVRSVMTANVIPLSLSERLLLYRSCEYYSFDPSVGTMRITYSPNLQSQTQLTSLMDPQAPDEPFFPAYGESSFYFVITMLSGGISVFNPAPMAFSGNTNWPVFEWPMYEQGPVQFNFQQDPSTPCMIIQNQYMSMYPTSELAITLLNASFNDSSGAFEGTWEIRNLTPHSEIIRWFAMGDLGKTETPPFGAVEIGPVDSLKGVVSISFAATLEKSTLTQFIAMSAVSQSGPRMTGTAKTFFQYPLAAPQLSKYSFVATLLGIDTLPQHVANADRNHDFKLDGRDVALYVQQVINP